MGQHLGRGASVGSERDAGGVATCISFGVHTDCMMLVCVPMTSHFAAAMCHTVLPLTGASVVTGILV